MSVQLACIDGYTLSPPYVRRHCENKKWDKHENPRCIKTCQLNKLFCSDSMRRTCKYNGNLVQCESTMLPGTEVGFECNIGYRWKKHATETNIAVTCQEDGTWSENLDMDKYCELDCGHLHTNTIKPLATSGTPIEPEISPWTVVIYAKDQEHSYKKICGGVRVKPDIVLTAAHCVLINDTIKLAHYRVGGSTNVNRTVGEDYGWAVSKIETNRNYDPSTMAFDTALLKLNLTSVDRNKAKVICLPWQFDEYMYEMGNTVAEVCSLSNGTNSLRLTMVESEVLNRTSDQQFHIAAKAGEFLCEDDTGSGFITNCYHKHTKTRADSFCLYGVVSFANRGLDKQRCSKNVVLTNTSGYYNRDFISSTIDYMTTCDQY
ncbi:modular serine protease-like [Drosophila grimshawi]|uniref:modular serine protease-like n=1 Tax=Drosophila grimshawi TaxID=7222 RepID=UPI001C934A98|nr:modular serine protease-like [Drosophila grimshawi]